ncbi:MAG: cell division protein BolA [Bdellovibrio bacteriovorus]
MSVCREIKHFSRAHERIADFFSLLALALLFATVWAVLYYHQQMLAWIASNVLLHSALVILALVLDVFVILGLLTVGSARFGEDNERCFGTFPGRRSFRSKTGLFGAWIAHMENVGKRHR